MDYFDRAARSAARLKPAGFIRWLLPSLPDSMAFRGWLDTRTPPFPGEPERTCDTLASFENLAAPDEWWAVPVEFQTEPASDILDRILEYLARLRRGLRHGTIQRGKYHVAAALVHLTGPVQPNALTMQLPGLPEVGLNLQVALRTLRTEEASTTLEGIAAGRIDRCILPWIPLMHDGSELRTIMQWQDLASTEPDSGLRSAYASLALVFAELTDSLPDWKQALEGWNMRQSQVVLGWQAERARADVLRLLELRLPGPIPADLRATIEGITDLNELSRWFDAAATADTLETFQTAVMRAPSRENASTKNGA
jgi:hypothetical protein